MSVSKSTQIFPRPAQRKISKKARSTIRTFNTTTGISIHKKTKSLPVKDSVYKQQLYGVNCPTPSGKRTVMINLKNY